MFHVYEFEVFEDEGFYLAVPFDLQGGTQGETLAEACEMAAACCGRSASSARCMTRNSLR